MEVRLSIVPILLFVLYYLCVHVRPLVGAAEGEQSPRPALCNRIEKYA